MMTDTILINTILPAFLIGTISITFICYACILIPIVIAEANILIRTRRCPMIT